MPLYASLDVRTFGARGNGSSDDTNAIQNAVNSCPMNGTITFSAGNYVVRGVWLKSYCTYVGVAGSTITLSAPGRFIFDLSEQLGVRVTGLVLDGNNNGGGIIAQRYAPAYTIQIDNCEFRNISASAPFPSNLAIVSTWGIVDATIQSNRFNNVAGGIWLTTVQNVGILNNSFQDVTQGNAVYIAPNPSSFHSGDNLRISGNTGSHMARMGIEIFRPDPTNGSVLTAPVIENNSFSDWTGGSEGMGLSITHGDGAIIRGNKITNTNGPGQLLGIEVIVSDAQVSGNVISSGFLYGIAVQGKPGAIITGNTITNAADTGILLACDSGRNRCSGRDSVISNNTIHNARVVGIKLDNDWTNTHVTRNTIVRTSGQFQNDNETLFSGISQAPAPGPGFIDSNVIVQDALTPVPGFWFCGVRINSQMPGSAVTNNAVRSQSSSPFGSGLIDNTGTATQGWLISGNTYTNLSRAIN
jgi:parallel beta-helix repeat protein